MKVLITGGCGFLGSNIAASFLNDGVEVVIIDALFRKGSSSNLAWLEGQAKTSRFEFHQADMAEASAVDRIVQDRGPFDYVCHLAGQVAMTTSLTEPRRDFNTNALGTFNLLEAVRVYSPEALVAYSSTNKVYGDLRDLEYQETDKRYIVPQIPKGFNETLRLDFASPYGCSKGAADQYVRDWHRNYGLKTVVFRHSSIYGGRQFATYDQGWIGWFCEKALEQASFRQRGHEIDRFTISGSGKQVRDVLHAEDLISLYRAAFERRVACAGEIFNIGGGLENSLSLLELFDMLSRLANEGVPLEFDRLPRRQSDQDFFVADISKATALLGWRPRISKEAGLARMIDWVRGNREASTR